MTACSTGISNRSPDPLEPERRRPGASGIPVTLADGQTWLFAHPRYQPRHEGLTRPRIDGPLDRIFDRAVLNEGLPLCDLWEVARELLRANYDLSGDELNSLLTVPRGDERQLASDVLDAVSGIDSGGKGYTAWVRASLLANGLGGVEIPARDLPNVLAVLVATNRTISLPNFADACRLLDERARLESLI